MLLTATFQKHDMPDFKMSGNYMKALICLFPYNVIWELPGMAACTALCVYLYMTE